MCFYAKNLSFAFSNILILKDLINVSSCLHAINILCSMKMYYFIFYHFKQAFRELLTLLGQLCCLRYLGTEPSIISATRPQEIVTKCSLSLNASRKSPWRLLIRIPHSAKHAAKVLLIVMSHTSSDKVISNNCRIDLNPFLL